MGESSAMGRDLSLRRCRRGVSEKQIESLDHETESHDRNAGAHPGKKGALVGGVIAVTLDHRARNPACPRVGFPNLFPRNIRGGSRRRSVL